MVRPVRHWALLLIAGCTASPPIQKAPAPRIEWGFQRCDEIRADHRCELAPSSARPNASLEVELWVRVIGGVLLPIEAKGGELVAGPRVDGGQRWSFKLTANQSEIRLAAQSNSIPNSPQTNVQAELQTTVARLTVARVAPTPKLAKEELDRLLAAPESVDDGLDALDASRRAHAYLQLGLAAFRQPLNADWRARQLKWFSRSHEGFRALGAIRTASRTEVLIAEILRRQANYADAQRRLTTLLEQPALPVDIEIVARNTLAPILLKLGALRAGITQLEQASIWSHRLGLSHQRRLARGAMLEPLERLGATTRADRLAKMLLKESLPLAAHDCSHVQAISLVYWWALLRADSMGETRPAEVGLGQAQLPGQRVKQTLIDRLEGCAFIRSDAALNLAESEFRRRA
ncbi:MAG: hypothetical protein AAFV29_21690, partial [Myxococcota bacterium]